MPAKLETLSGGLVTSMDPVLAPEGTLIRAQNARYRPGDPALWHAEGRKMVSGGGHGGSHWPPMLIGGLVWDPGTTVDGEIEDRHQILYKSISFNGLYTVSAKDDPSDPAMASANRRTWAQPGNYVFGGPFHDIVSYRNDFYIFSGGSVNHWFYRGSAGQVLSRQGMKENTLAPTWTYSAAAGAVSVTDVVFTVWFVWYDSANNIEGAASVDATARQHIASTSLNQYTLLVLKSEFDAAVPVEADSIRVYIGRVSGTSATSDTTQAWPVGGLFKEKLISGLVTTTIGLNNYYDLFATATLADVVIDGTFDPTAGYVPAPVTTVATLPISTCGEPPISTTGDVFEESIVQNDKDDPRKVWYSAPGQPHYFPSLFFINFETKDADEVVAIRTLGNQLGVYLKTSIWRVNWLPSASDFDFGRGRVKDVVAEDMGTFSSRSVTSFTHPRFGPVQAFVDWTGIYLTDLDITRSLTESLDWPTIRALGELKNSMLVNDPDEKRLVFSIGTSLFYLHYDLIHLDKSGVPAITGPIERPGGVYRLVTVRTEGGLRVVVSTDGRKSSGEINNSHSMYYEGRGFAEDADTSATLLLDAETREIYPYGVGEEGKTANFLIHMKPSGYGSGTWYGILKAKTVQGESVALTDQIILAERTLKTTTSNRLFESYSVQLNGVATSASMAVNLVGVRSDSLGEADSR